MRQTHVSRLVYSNNTNDDSDDGDNDNNTTASRDRDDDATITMGITTDIHNYNCIGTNCDYNKRAFSISITSIIQT